MRFLRTNTAVIITVGPFYDKTDGVTIETGLTITNERITLSADTDDGSAPTNILDNLTGATSGTANDLNYITGNDAGMMQIELSAANVNRLGRMLLSITDAANHVPVFHEFMVLNTALYDALFASSGGAIPNAVAGAAGGVFIAGTNAATTVTTALTTTFTGNLTGSVASVTGAVSSVTGAVGSVTAGVTLAASAVQAIWDALTSALTTVGSIGKLIVDNVNATISSRATPAQVNTEVLDCLVTDTHAEASGVPAATSSIKDKLNWLFALGRNKLTQTSTTQTLRNDADSGSIATAAVADDGTTASRAKWS